MLVCYRGQNSRWADIQFRKSGCAALDMAYVASGDTTVFFKAI